MRHRMCMALCALCTIVNPLKAAQAQRIATLAQAEVAIANGGRWGARWRASSSSHAGPRASFNFEPRDMMDVRLGMLPQSTATQPQDAPPAGEEINNGQDFTRPVRRLDVRYQYQQPDSGLHTNIFTLRMDWPFTLSEEWKLSTRVDLPLMYSDVPSSDNPDGSYEFGTADVLAQALLIHPLNAEVAVAGGLQAIFPTDSQDQFGSGSLRLLPSIAVRYGAAWMPKGWWTALVARYDVDVWKRDGRESTSAFSIQPVLNIALPHRWFATFAPEFKYSFIDDAWFIPFDVTVGTMLSPTTIASVEFKHELYDALPQYDWSVEFRIGFFF